MAVPAVWSGTERAPHPSRKPGGGGKPVRQGGGGLGGGGSQSPIVLTGLIGSAPKSGASRIVARAKAAKRRIRRRKKLSDAVNMAPKKNTCLRGMSMRRRGFPPTLSHGVTKRIR